MHQVTPVATAVIAVFLVWSAALRARTERHRPVRSGRPVRTWYIALCAVVVVLAVVGAFLVISGQM